MLKKTITYTDYNGVERTEDFYFNLTKAEIHEMSFSKEGGLDEYAQRLINTDDFPEIIKLFKEIIDKAYGVKSLDGKRFDKDPKHIKEFKETEAYSELYMELATNTDAASSFFNALVPKDLILEDHKPSAKN